MAGDPKTTVWGMVSSLGSLLTAAGVFYPPLILVGGVVSALGKALMSMNTPDKDTVVKKDDLRAPPVIVP